MKIDSEEHREFILKMLDGTPIPGAALDRAIEFRNAVRSAAIEDSKSTSATQYPTIPSSMDGDIF